MMTRFFKFAAESRFRFRSTKVYTILVLDKNFNSRDSFAFCQPVEKSPYTKYGTFVYDVNDPDSIGNQTYALVKAVSKAIDHYYSMNGYKNPDSFEKPDFDKR